eukprot:11558166-Alexandrium_andersonii.AAC.1
MSDVRPTLQAAPWLGWRRGSKSIAELGGAGSGSMGWSGAGQGSAERGRIAQGAVAVRAKGQGQAQ